MELPLYNLSDMAAATKSFSDDNKIGEGGFGPVYRVSFWHSSLRTTGEIWNYLNLLREDQLQSCC